MHVYMESNCTSDWEFHIIYIYYVYLSRFICTQFPVADIPYEKMWLDDQQWLPFLLQGRRFCGYFLFKGQTAILAQHLQLSEKLHESALVGKDRVVLSASETEDAPLLEIPAAAATATATASTSFLAGQGKEEKSDAVSTNTPGKDFISWISGKQEELQKQTQTQTQTQTKAPTTQKQAQTQTQKQTQTQILTQTHPPNLKASTRVTGSAKDFLPQSLSSLFYHMRETSTATRSVPKA